MCRRNYEYACGVLMMMMFPPHFLVYDQTLLAIPLVMLWASPAWPWGVLLLAVSAVPLANLSFMLGFSVTGIVGLATMVGAGSPGNPSDGQQSRLAAIGDAAFHVNCADYVKFAGETADNGTTKPFTVGRLIPVIPHV